MTIREMAERIRWMVKVKDCRSICITCEYYELCRLTGAGAGEGEKEDEHEVCKKK